MPRMRALLGPSLLLCALGMMMSGCGDDANYCVTTSWSDDDGRHWHAAQNVSDVDDAADWTHRHPEGESFPMFLASCSTRPNGRHGPITGDAETGCGSIGGEAPTGYDPRDFAGDVEARVGDRVGVEVAGFLGGPECKAK